MDATAWDALSFVALLCPPYGRPLGWSRSAPADRNGLGGGKNLAVGSIPGCSLLKAVRRHVHHHDLRPRQRDALDRDRHQALAKSEQAAEWQQQLDFAVVRSNHAADASHGRLVLVDNRQIE